MTAPSRTSRRPTALVALRDPGEGKTRLSPPFTRRQRADVARAMARDVVAALVAAGVDDVLVVAEGSRAVGFAQALGLDVLRDRGGGAGLNAALLDGLRLIGPRADALLVAADLPGLGALDVSRVLAADADVVVAPTRDGGTGGLLLRAGVRIDLSYGPASADAHRRTALEDGLRVATVATPGFHHDVDEPTDLDDAVARWPGSHTGRTVRGWDATPASAGPARGVRGLQPVAVHPVVPAILNTSTRANG